MTRRENVLRKYGLEDRSYSIKELSKITKVPVSILKEVYDRGIGAYKTNPTSVRLKNSYVKNVSAPMKYKLSKENWAMARLYSFLDGNPRHDADLRANKGGDKLYTNNTKMPYKLRKAPKRDLYWVVGPDGKHHSKDPMPKDRAEAQRRAIYASETKRGGEGSDSDSSSDEEEDGDKKDIKANLKLMMYLYDIDEIIEQLNDGSSTDEIIDAYKGFEKKIAKYLAKGTITDKTLEEVEEIRDNFLALIESRHPRKKVKGGAKEGKKAEDELSELISAFNKVEVAPRAVSPPRERVRAVAQAPPPLCRRKSSRSRERKPKEAEEKKESRGRGKRGGMERFSLAQNSRGDWIIYDALSDKTLPIRSSEVEQVREMIKHSNRVGDSMTKLQSKMPSSDEGEDKEVAEAFAPKKESAKKRKLVFKE
jgi:hypothetical protein